MNPTSLQHKTIRPGSLGTYNYYHSAPRPAAVAAPKVKRVSSGSGLGRKVAATLFVLACLIGLPLLRPFGGNDGVNSVNSQSPVITPQSAASVAAVTKPANNCAGNKLDKLILVSISQRRLWACQGTKTAYQTPVITGMLAHPDTTTPPGTYHVYAKQTNTTLTGSDSTGAWSDPVGYWMPFLDNEHGTYGFHDATWRNDNEFGNVDPATANASHGCVELPLGASQWLYNWAPLHATVTIAS